jgi:hypothetical protein
VQRVVDAVIDFSITHFTPMHYRANHSLMMNILGERYMKKPIFAAMLAIWFIASIVYFIPVSKAQPNLYLTGKVVSKSSKNPVSSVWVEVVKSGKRVGRSLTGDDGRYYISGLGKGSYEIVVAKNKQELYRCQLRLKGNRTLDITL